MNRRAELVRKLIHAGLFVVPLLAWHLSATAAGAVRLGLSVLALLVLLVDLARFRWPPLERRIEALAGRLLRPGERRHPAGATTWFIALALAFLLLPRSLALAAAAFLVFGDAAAALAGRAFGRRVIRGTKTLEGSAACLATCLLLGPLLGRLDPALDGGTLVAGAVAATLAEMSAGGDVDNLLVPLASGLAMRLVAGAS